MKTSVLQFNLEIPSGSAWDRMTPFMKKTAMLKFRDAVIGEIGEGPYRKVYLDKNTPKTVRDQIVESLTRLWPERRRVFTDITVRRPKILAFRDHIEGLRPVLDGIQWSGWSVSDHGRWLRTKVRDQVVGDEKIVIELFLPETAAEESDLERRFA